MENIIRRKLSISSVLGILFLILVIGNIIHSNPAPLNVSYNTPLSNEEDTGVQVSKIGEINDGYNFIGDNDGLADAGEKIGIRIELFNTLSITLHNVNATISTHNQNVQILVNIQQYIELFPASHQISASYFVIQLNSTLNQSDSVILNVEIKTQEGNWNDSTSLKIYSNPNPEFLYYKVNQEMQGDLSPNFNRNLDAGELCEISIFVLNNADCRYLQVFATTTSTSPFIQIIDPIASFGDFELEEIKEARVQLNISGATPSDYTEQISLLFTDFLNSTKIVNFSITINGTPEIAIVDFNIMEELGDMDGNFDVGEYYSTKITLRNLGTAIGYQIPIILQTIKSVDSISSLGQESEIISGFFLSIPQTPNQEEQQGSEFFQPISPGLSEITNILDYLPINSTKTIVISNTSEKIHNFNQNNQDNQDDLTKMCFKINETLEIGDRFHIPIKIQQNPNNDNNETQNITYNYEFTISGKAQMHFIGWEFSEDEGNSDQVLSAGIEGTLKIAFKNNGTADLFHLFCVISPVNSLVRLIDRISGEELTNISLNLGSFPQDTIQTFYSEKVKFEISPIAHHGDEIGIRIQFIDSNFILGEFTISTKIINTKEIISLQVVVLLQGLVGMIYMGIYWITFQQSEGHYKHETKKKILKIQNILYFSILTINIVASCYGSFLPLIFTMIFLILDIAIRKKAFHKLEDWMKIKKAIKTNPLLSRQEITHLVKNRNDLTKHFLQITSKQSRYEHYSDKVNVISRLLDSISQYSDQAKLAELNEEFEIAQDQWNKVLANYKELMIISENRKDIQIFLNQMIKKEDIMNQINIILLNIGSIYFKHAQKEFLSGQTENKKMRFSKAINHYEIAFNKNLKGLESLQTNLENFYGPDLDYGKNLIQFFSLRQRELEIQINIVKGDQFLQLVKHSQDEKNWMKIHLALRFYRQAEKIANQTKKFPNLLDHLQIKQVKLKELYNSMLNQMEFATSDTLENNLDIFDNIIFENNEKDAKIASRISFSDNSDDNMHGAEKLKIIRSFDYLGGNIRFKVGIINQSNQVLTNLDIGIQIPPSFQIVSYIGSNKENEPFQHQNEIHFSISKLGIKNQETFEIILEPRNCLVSQIQAYIVYYDSKDQAHAQFMAPQEITIKCPLFFTKETANFARIQNLIPSLPYQQNKIFPIYQDLSLEIFYTMISQIFERYDIIPVQSPNELEKFYYGLSKIQQQPFVFRFEIKPYENVFQIEVFGHELGQLTAFLADYTNRIRNELQEIYTYNHQEFSDTKFLDVRTALASNHCPYCFSPLNREMMDNQQDQQECPYCKVHIDLQYL